RVMAVRKCGEVGERPVRAPRLEEAGRGRPGRSPPVSGRWWPGTGWCRRGDPVNDETVGDGAFQGIVMPCQMCLGSGELVTLQKDPTLLRRGDCPQCDGTGHIRIRCTRDEVDEVIRSLPPSRLLVAVRQALTGVGLCPVCFGCGVLASV